MLKKLFPAICIFALSPLLLIQSGPGQMETSKSWQSLLDKNLSNRDKFIDIPDSAYYKDIHIQSIQSLPKQYAKYFE